MYILYIINEGVIALFKYYQVNITYLLQIPHYIHLNYLYLYLLHSVGNFNLQLLQVQYQALYQEAKKNVCRVRKIISSQYPSLLKKIKNCFQHD